MATDDDEQTAGPEKTAKEIIDEGTQADLERWFGLPSVQAVLERGDTVATSDAQADEDPKVAAARERREAAMAAADPAFLERHRVRWERTEELLQFKSEIEPIIDPSIAMLDMQMLERQVGIADPRDRELPQALIDDLRECAPQALLRDLHRPELTFDKTFEVIDMAADNRIVIADIVRVAMTTNWHIASFDELPFRGGRELILSLAAIRKGSLAALLPSLPNRKVKE